MAPPLLKICGLRDSGQAAAVAQLGVDAIGVIGVPGSPRFLEAERRPALFAAMRAAAPGCRGVLVVADPLEQQWPQLELGQGHAVVQLHGSETPQLCGQLWGLADALSFSCDGPNRPAASLAGHVHLLWVTLAGCCEAAVCPLFIASFIGR